MIIIGIILMVAGAGSFIYGNSLNNSFDAQMESLFSTGSINSGDIYLYIGIAAFIIGIVLAVIGAIKKKN